MVIATNFFSQCGMHKPIPRFERTFRSFATI